MSVGVVLETFWMDGWGKALAAGISPPVDVLFESARTRAVLSDPTTGAAIEDVRTRATLENPGTDAVAENPHTTAVLT